PAAGRAAAVRAGRGAHARRHRRPPSHRPDVGDRVAVPPAHRARWADGRRRRRDRLHPRPCPRSRGPGLMRLESLEPRRIALDLVTPFRTSFGTEERRDILLLHVTADAGGGRTVEGWGECVAMKEPLYSSEFVDAAQLVIEQFMWPAL